MLVVIVEFRAEDEVVCKDIGREGDDGDPEPREEIAEHHAFLENGTMAPGIPLRPWISEKW